MALRCTVGDGPATIELLPGDGAWLLRGRLIWGGAGVNVTGSIITITPESDTDASAAVEAARGRSGLLADVRAAVRALQLSAFQVEATTSAALGVGGTLPGPVRVLDARTEPGWLVNIDSLVGLETGLHARVAHRQASRLQTEQHLAGLALLRIWGSGALLVAGAGGLIELDPATFGGAIQVPVTAFVGCEAGLSWQVDAADTPKGTLGRAEGFTLVTLRGRGRVLVSHSALAALGPDVFVDARRADRTG